MTNDTAGEVSRELARIEENGLYTSKGHFAAAGVWQGIYWILGLVGASSAALVPQVRMLGAVAAVCVAASTFLNPAARHKDHLRAGNAFLAIQQEARRLRTIRLQMVTASEAADLLEEIAKRYADLTDNCPKVPWIGYRLGQRGIAKGEAENTVDQ